MGTGRGTGEGGSIARCPARREGDCAVPGPCLAGAGQGIIGAKRCRNERRGGEAKVQGSPAAHLGLALLFGIIAPALAAGSLAAAELRAGTGVRIEQAGAVTADDTGGSFTVTSAPQTAVSLSITADRPGVAEVFSDAGPTPATDAAGALVVHLADRPGSYQIIVHY